MTRKIIFFDIDGTIYQEGFGMHPQTADAIRRCGEKGHLLMLCTGRGMSSIPDAVRALPFDGGVFGCGTHVQVGDQVLLDEAVMGTHCREVIEILYRNRCPFFVNNSDYIYYDPDYPPANFGETLQRMRYAYHGRLRPLDENPGRLSKLTAYPKDPARIPQIAAQMAPWFDCITHTDHAYIELVAKGCTKGTGISLLLQRLAIPRANSYGIGDSGNDIPMLEAVGQGIIMAQAPEEIKGDYIRAGSVYEGGIAGVLQQLGLI